MVERYRCVSCGKIYDSNYFSTGESDFKCKKCRDKVDKIEKEMMNKIEMARKKEKEFRIKERKKQLKGKDPYEVLAQMKMMLHRSKKQSVKSTRGWWVGPHSSDARESILRECEEILDAYEIPSKYLIAEALDSKEE